MEMQRPKMEEEEEEEEEEERRKKKWPWMKAAQLLEFQVQALVYRYIEAGLQVPHHLLVPIWNSLARSPSSSTSDYFIHHNHSSSSLMLSEAEPTRCRRTDGKKWRCSRTVLPFQKYCERHIHRGRKRSRKLVESSSSSSHDQSHHGTTTVSVSSSNAAQVVTVASFACPPPLTITNKTASHGENTPCVQKFFPEVSSDISLEEASKKDSSNTKKNDIIARSSGREWKNINGLLFPSIHFSPNTVLQGETDNEPGRCRRTDGKKWRCSKDVISGQKYCDKHMHRGIKKNKKHPVEKNTGFTPLTMARSVSILGIPLVTRVPEEKSNSSSCSTDTTITDTALRGQEEEEDNEEVLSLCCSSGV